MRDLHGADRDGRAPGSTRTSARSPPPARPVPSQDPTCSHYFGTDPAIDIEKSTNGMDADAGTRPADRRRRPVAWTYVITNTGNVPLTLVGDATTRSPRARLSAAPDPQPAGQVLTCRAVGRGGGRPVREHRPRSVGTIPNGTSRSTDTDLSHYFGMPGAIDIEKSTNGERRRPAARAVRRARLHGRLDLRRHEHREHRADQRRGGRTSTGSRSSARRRSIRSRSGRSMTCTGQRHGPGRPVHQSVAGHRHDGHGATSSATTTRRTTSARRPGSSSRSRPTGTTPTRRPARSSRSAVPSTGRTSSRTAATRRSATSR